MKKIFIALAMCASLVSIAQAGRGALAKSSATEKPGTTRQTKYICSIGDMSDAVFTEEYETREECSKYCKGIAAVCEETGLKTDVNLTDVD